MLRTWAIPVLTPYDPANLDAVKPDLVIIGNVHPPGEPGGDGGARAAAPADELPGGARGVLPPGPPLRGRGRHARQDHDHRADRPRAGRGRPGPVVPRRRRHAELRRELPARRGPALRGRGRRVRHGLLRQGPEVPPLPAADGHPHQRRVRPRRHLPRPRPLRGRVRAIRPPAAAGRAASRSARRTRTRCGSRGSLARRAS